MKFRIDVQSVSEICGQKNDTITLIVFNDSIVVVKRRIIPSNKHLMSAAASVANLRSPTMSRKSILPGQLVTNAQHTPKPFKFLEIIPHVAIVRVVDLYKL